MNKESCNNVYSWDYKGWKSRVGEESSYAQRDWNVTLITLINQCSAQICAISLRGGGDTIKVNRSIYEIIRTLPFFDEHYQMLSGRYDVLIDDNIGNDIYVYNCKCENPIAIPRYTRGETNDRGETPLYDLDFIRIDECSESEVTNYIGGCRCCIEVLNYFMDE